MQHPEHFPEDGGLATRGPGNQADRMTGSGLGRCRRTTATRLLDREQGSPYSVTLKIDARNRSTTVGSLPDGRRSWSNEADVCPMCAPTSP